MWVGHLQLQGLKTCRMLGMPDHPYRQHSHKSGRKTCLCRHWTSACWKFTANITFLRLVAGSLATRTRVALLQLAGFLEWRDLIYWKIPKIILNFSDELALETLPGSFSKHFIIGKQLHQLARSSKEIKIVVADTCPHKGDETWWKPVVDLKIPGLVNIQKTMERSTTMLFIKMGKSTSTINDYQWPCSI